MSLILSCIRESRGRPRHNCSQRRSGPRPLILGPEVSPAILVGSAGRLIRGFADLVAGTTSVASRATLLGIVGSRL